MTVQRQNCKKADGLALLLVLSLLLATKTSFVLAEDFQADDSSQAESHYKLMESHHLEFPSMREFFTSWQTFGTSLILKDRVVVTPEIVDKKGAIQAKSIAPPQCNDEFIADVRLNIENTDSTIMGNSAAAIYYLQDINHEDIGKGTFGYSANYRGLGVFMNNILSKTEGDNVYNYLQVIYNDGERPVNVMKINPERSCRRKIRNLEGNKDFFVRIEYQNKQISVSTWDHGTGQLEHCVSFMQEMKFQGVFMVSGASGTQNPDHIYLEYFGLYNMHEKVSEAKMKQAHEKYKRRALHQIADYDTESLTKDLVHNNMKSFFNKKNFQEDHMLAMIPTQLTYTKDAMSNSLKEMYKNLNYYYKVTGPLHNHKTYGNQVQQINEVTGNLTLLSKQMEEIKGQIDGYESGLHDQAKDYITKGDYYMNMNNEDKNNLYDEATTEFEKSIGLALKKFGVMKKKVAEITDLMHDFKMQTGKLESLYVKDINQRKKTYLDNPNIVGAANQVDFSKPVQKLPNADWQAIHSIFDEMEKEESRSTIGILFNLSNIIMMTVIAFSAFLFLKVEQSNRGKRMD